jgi:hypothetical protein
VRSGKEKKIENKKKQNKPVFRVSRYVHHHADKDLYKISGSKVSCQVNFMKQYTQGSTNSIV